MDGSGTLTAMELGKGLQALLGKKLSIKELGSLMEKFGDSELGEITFEEFVATLEEFKNKNRNRPAAPAPRL